MKYKKFKANLIGTLLTSLRGLATMEPEPILEIKRHCFQRSLHVLSYTSDHILIDNLVHSHIMKYE